jgi:hypothetical protein
VSTPHQVEVMSASSMGQFWAERELGSVARALNKRELGTQDRWQYTNFDGSDFRRMTLEERHYATHLLAGITTYRSFGGASLCLSLSCCHPPLLRCRLFVLSFRLCRPPPQ